MTKRRGWTLLEDKQQSLLETCQCGLWSFCTDLSAHLRLPSRPTGKSL